MEVQQGSLIIFMILILQFHVDIGQERNIAVKQEKFPHKEENYTRNNTYRTVVPQKQSTVKTNLQYCVGKIGVGYSGMM